MEERGRTFPQTVEPCTHGVADCMEATVEWVKECKDAIEAEPCNCTL